MPLLLTLQQMRSLLTEEFRQKKDATSVHTVNRLIVMGRMELEETLMLWKGPSHVRAHDCKSPPPTPLPSSVSHLCVR